MPIQAPSLDVSISGSGSMGLFDLSVQKAEVEIFGSGDCQVNVMETLGFEMSGSGKVRYKGEPRMGSKIRGGGDVRPCG